MITKIMARCLILGIISTSVALGVSVSASAQTGGMVTGNKVNVRDAGSLNESNVLFQVNQGQAVEILDTEGDYYKVIVNDDANVYIAREYVKITQTDGMAQEDTVSVYAAPEESADSVTIGLLNLHESVTVTAACGDWYCITFNGSPGYIRKQSLYIPPYAELQETTAPQKTSASFTAARDAYNLSDSELADEIIDYAKEFLGMKYIYGSMNPQRGFDCSGFVSYVMKNFDIAISRSSRDMASDGTGVSKSELQKCDLVFFATSGGKKISHVGMYIGNGKFIHASSWKGQVVITDLEDSYYSSRYIKATRIL